ncbi:MAG: hypothetical protein AAGA93_25315 [Actinomycetota bacterium]
MAVITYPFDTYRIFHKTRESISNETARIVCFDGSRWRGTLFFYRNPAPALASVHLGTDALYLRFDDWMYPHIIDTLRNESPLFLTLDDNTGRGWVATSDEPVGEEEG